ncbi:ADP-ribosylglycohydrolase family protein [Microscilla marina]|uniref:ADP-ribosylglycohydrolase superfamily n=1 Tax=Microscilla marina ATCC 23134 TaxID=313606 RepID=A1ZX79_MICM2|nr:ADP-ribosylglycohydrolase family protein [Microscilla marina]EAY25060.1 ADP-ribosylglycohydrolase superfamily [Microscilla marina ATCC 23134]
MNLQDILLGFAIGDAFGAGVEFQDRNWIRENIDFSSFVNVRSSVQALHTDIQNYHDWEYTDDTEMTIGLIKALISEQPFIEELLVKFWKKEYEEGGNVKGYTRAGHGSISWVYSGEKTIDEVRRFQQKRRFPGNAPATRALPIGFIKDHLINDYAIINANATHPHSKAIAASIIVARATQYLLVQKRKQEDIIFYCAEFIKDIDSDTFNLIFQVESLPPPSELTEQDYIVLCGPQPIEPPKFLAGIKGLPSDAYHTSACVLYLLKHSKSAFEGLKNAILMGGDVDSIASICTGILSGKYGISSLPHFMIESVEGKPYLNDLARRFYKYLDQKSS